LFLGLIFEAQPMVLGLSALKILPGEKTATHCVLTQTNLKIPITMPSRGGVPVAEALLPSGRNPERLSLPALQSKMKCDPEGYESELLLIRSQFDSSLELFKQQADMNFTSISGISNDPTVARDLAEKAMFLSHVTSFFPQHLTDFPHKLAELLHRAARTLPSGLRNDLTKSLILLINRQVCIFRSLFRFFGK
jgi:hypothetical protein